MIHQEKLTAVLADFARTLVTDFPIQDILDRVVERIVEVLPVSSAGVTLIAEGLAPQYVAASDNSALRYERLQTQVGQGPCLIAYQTSRAVVIPDLRSEKRFPLFTEAAADAGLAAVFTFPLRHEGGRLGALDLYRDLPGELSPEDLSAAQTLADVVAAYLINAQAREQAGRTADRLAHSAHHDPLTGLPNRALLEQRIDHAAQRAQRSHTQAAILFADIDRFKQVNDIYGHQVGDELLAAVAGRLSSLVRPGDTLARVSGDEFVFLCEDMTASSDAKLLAQRIDQAFGYPFLLTNVRVSVTASVGMAFAGPGENVSRTLVGEADLAMYQAKRKGGAAHQILDLTEVREVHDRSGLEADLRTAFAHGRLHVAYQPIVRSGDGLMTGVEALLRWSDPVRGSVPAIEMVAVAEQSGLMSEIGNWVLERACRDRSTWLAEHPSAPLDLSVNVSTHQLADPGFCATISRTLRRTKMDPGALILELTENNLIDDVDHVISVMAELKTLGLRLALDDFGTGYSSLLYLRRMSIDIVKIDQGFIADIGHDPTGPAIVAAVTNLAHVLGLEVTAEGVETQTQRNEIIALGCESAQGYFFANPMEASEIAEHLGAPSSPPPRLPLRRAEGQLAQVSGS